MKALNWIRKIVVGESNENQVVIFNAEWGFSKYGVPMLVGWHEDGRIHSDGTVTGALWSNTTPDGTVELLNNEDQVWARRSPDNKVDIILHKNRVSMTNCPGNNVELRILRELGENEIP